MLKKIIISIVLFFSLLFVPVAAASAAPPTFSPALIAAWQRVDTCENGGNWNHFSYWYPDGLGIDRPNWIQFGGSVILRSSKEVQIEIGERLIQHYHMGIPDQHYCSPW
jgi:hypothetical protein